jgi:hypothetical protein
MAWLTQTFRGEGYGGICGLCQVKYDWRKGWGLVGNGRAPARPTDVRQAKVAAGQSTAVVRRLRW